MPKEETISFGKFASLCQELEDISSSIAMREKLAKFFKEIPPSAIRYSSYFLLGRIGPKYADVNLGLGERTAIDIISLAFDKDKRDVKKEFKKMGDLGDAAQSFSQKKSSHLTIDDVYDALWSFKQTSGTGSQEKRAELLADLLQEASALEAKYIMRIALGSMRLGAGEMTVIDAFALAFAGGMESKDEVEDGYNVNTDIGALGESILERFSGEEFAAEEKYDGERVQVHKDGDDVQLFSRRLENITSQYPDIAEYARTAAKSSKAILDGEIVAWKDGKMLPFQKLMQRRRKYHVARYREKIPAALALFDIIYLEGESLLKKPYPERRDILEKEVEVGESEEPKDIFLARRTVSRDFEDIKKFFDQSIDKGFEGIIVKATSKDSFYQPSRERGVGSG